METKALPLDKRVEAMCLQDLTEPLIEGVPGARWQVACRDPQRLLTLLPLSYRNVVNATHGTASMFLKAGRVGDFHDGLLAVTPRELVHPLWANDPVERHSKGGKIDIAQEKIELCV
jgi:hypothetical protein